jgi:hypothetical protein
MQLDSLSRSCRVRYSIVCLDHLPKVVRIDLAYGRRPVAGSSNAELLPVSLNELSTPLGTTKTISGKAKTGLVVVSFSVLNRYVPVHNVSPG